MEAEGGHASGFPTTRLRTARPPEGKEGESRRDREAPENRRETSVCVKVSVRVGRVYC